MVATPQIRPDFALSIRVVRETAELWNLASDWKHLFHTTECNNVFLSFEWLSQWWAHFGQNFRLFVVTVRENDGHLVGVAPLYISKELQPLSLRRLGQLGDKFVGSDHLGFLAENACLPEALQAIWNFIFDQRKEWDFIEFASASDSIALTQFQNVLHAAQMMTYRTVSSLCPYFELPSGTEEYWNSLRPKLRKNIRYQTRSLQREGQLNFVTIEGTSEIGSALDDLLRLHQVRSERRGRNSTFIDPKVAPFHRSALLSLVAQGQARIFFLELSGKRIAAL